MNRSKIILGILILSIIILIFSGCDGGNLVTPTNTYTITAFVGSHGSINPSGEITVNQGSDKSFTITPVIGYSIDDVLVDGSSVGAVSSYTFTNVTENHTISAIFTPVTPTMILSPVVGDLEIVNSIEQCSDTKWCFNQHKICFTGGVGHCLGGGLCRADDTYAWDANLNTPFHDSDNGKPVYAVEEGIVSQTYGGCTNAGGSYGQLLIEHTYKGNPWWSGYVHLKDIQVVCGQHIKDKSTLIGYISNTGTDNNHLHFVVYKGQNSQAGLISFDAEITPRDFPQPSIPDNSVSNVALGKPVSVTTNGADEPHEHVGEWPSDTTDGSLDYQPVSSGIEDGCVAWVNDDYNELMVVTVTIDLQGTYSISKIRYNMGNCQRAETWNVDIMESPFGRIPTNPGTPYSGAWTEQTGNISASSVTIKFEKTRTAWERDWLFIGEIEVWGTPVGNPV